MKDLSLKHSRSAFHFNAELDMNPAFHLNADPDPGPTPHQGDATLPSLAYRPSRPPFRASTALHGSMLTLEPRKLLRFDFYADLESPDPAFHSKNDPDPASKNTADLCGSGSKTLSKPVEILS
jgi:hypothetical protein